MTRSSALALVLGAAAVSACGDDRALDAADEEHATLVTPAELGLGDDWAELAPGLWTRSGPDGGQEFAGLGEPGRQHALASLEEVEEGLKTLLADDEREETRAQLKELDALITELRASEPPLAGPEIELRCNPSVAAVADASSISCGVAAKANASWSHCSSTGTVRAYAQAGCGGEVKTHQCGSKTGNPVSCAAQTSITGPAPCRSFAYAQISAPNAYVYVWDENVTRGTCSPPPLPPPGCGGVECPAGKSCHCGDVCRPINTYCP